MEGKKSNISPIFSMVPSFGWEGEREREEDKKGGGYNPSTLSTLSEWKRIHKRNDDDKEKRPQGEKVTCVSVTAV